MQITLTIPDELAAQAQARGLALDHYLPELLAETLAAEPESRATPLHSASKPDDSSQLSHRYTAEQRNAAVEALLGFAEKYGVTTGGQDLESMIHEGHKY